MSEMTQFPEEVQHLQQLLQKLRCAFQQSQDSVVRYDEEYRESKQYLADYRSEIDSREIFQSTLLMNQIEQSGLSALQLRDRLYKLVDSPYFARIDFHTPEEEAPVPYYIGRFSFAGEEDILIYDWRAPVSSMFYDFELGTASYQAPIGKIEGTISRKRQFKIKNSQMEYVLESAVNIQDEVLQRELSHTSDEKMKTIIATLQKEQNQIIRDDRTSTMIIQGVAGSGKTSIALHRIAYLLYRRKGTLTAKNIVILSPNKVFADYISNVLPELGEEPIYEMSFVDIAEIQLEGIIKIQLPKDPLETQETTWKERAVLKSSLTFVDQLNTYLQYAISAYFQPEDYILENLTVSKDWIKQRYLAYDNLSVKRRLEEVAEDILDRLASENIWKLKLPKSSVVVRHLQKLFRMKNTIALYKDFYQWLGKPKSLSFPEKNTLEWEDVYPFLYVHAAYADLQDGQRIQHVVIDEMQDYTPIQYAVIHKLFPCEKTILGDFSQSINPNYQYSPDLFRSLFQQAALIALYKSYRSTFEIITFARAIQPSAEIQPILRHGAPPEIHFCETSDAELTLLRTQLDCFSKRASGSLGIILKTESQAKALYDLLSPDYTIHLLTANSHQFSSGISITSVQMSKGLEFDDVLIPDASHENYYTEFHRRLLFVACTRAMHHLYITYTGELTPWIPNVL